MCLGSDEEFGVMVTSLVCQLAHKGEGLMNKFKKRKRLSVIVAVFILTLFSGSAFALGSLDPLVFNSTANVGTSLRLLITAFDDVTGNPFNLETHVRPNPIPPVGSQPGPGESQPGVRIVHDADVIFTAPGQHILWYFTVTNVGTMPARINSINFNYGTDSSWFFNVPAHLWGYHTEVHNYNDLIGMVLTAGESVEFEILVEWNPDFSLWPPLPDAAREALADPNVLTLPFWFRAELFYVPAN